MGVVIVGAGRAGAKLAEALRQHGYARPITLVGEEPHLPYDRPPLSKDLLAGSARVQGVPLFDADFYARHAIALRLGVRAVEVRRSARQVRLADGTELAYEHLVLAPGLRSRPLRGFALGGRLYHLRTLDDAHALAAALRRGPRVLLVGGGLLGLEIAATARRLGCEVSVVERHPALLYQSVAPVVGDHVKALHLRHGVRILTGVTPRVLGLASAAGGDAGTAVYAELSDGATIAADIVVAATGSIANTELAEACGLEVQDGIIVDAHGRTSDPAIYAVGDAARHYNALLGRTIRVESWHHAQHQSAAVARAIAGQPQPYAEVPWFWSDQFDMNLQIAGYSSDWDRVVVRGNPAQPRFSVFYLQGQRLVAANAVNRGRDIRSAQTWIAERTPLDAGRLADERVELERAELSASVPAGSGG